MNKTYNNLIYKELSYKIIGALMEVFNNLGSGHKEVYYQRATAIEFRKRGIGFREQVRVEMFYNSEFIGLQVLDFIIEEKIVLEIKKDEIFSLKHIQQTHGYLKNLKLKLGILANFTKYGIKSKRILNLD